MPVRKRKLRRPLPPATDPQQEFKPQPPIVAPEGNGREVPRTPSGARLGRPTNAERQAKLEAQPPREPQVSMTPEEMRPMTVVILATICKAARGDRPTESEIDMVNPPATVVANKYGMRGAPELALLGAILIVVQAARERRSEKMQRELAVKQAQQDRAVSAGPQFNTAGFEAVEVPS